MSRSKIFSSGTKAEADQPLPSPFRTLTRRQPREGRGVWTWVVAVTLSSLALSAAVGWYQARTRIARALELLSASTEEIVRPARLERVLSGIQYEPRAAVAAKDSETLVVIPNGGVPPR